MTSDGVIIELKHKPDENNRNGKTYTDASTGSRKITVKRFEEPQGSNFYKYTYENENKNDSHGGNFILKAIWDDSGKHIEIPLPDDKKVTSVSAYYWSGNPTKVLLVEVSYSGSGTKYYKNSGGNQWIEQHLDRW